jgi:hypothetical protein
MAMRIARHLRLGHRPGGRPEVKPALELQTRQGRLR